MTEKSIKSFVNGLVADGAQVYPAGRKAFGAETHSATAWLTAGSYDALTTRATLATERTPTGPTRTANTR